MTKEIVYIVCPLCGLNRVLEKKGTQAEKRGKLGKVGRISFDKLDPETAPFVDIREAPGGKVKVDAPRGTIGKGKAPGKGFHRVASLTLAESAGYPAYRDLVEQLKTQIKVIEGALSFETENE